jgi:hypothetical protein
MIGALLAVPCAPAPAAGAGAGVTDPPAGSGTADRDPWEDAAPPAGDPGGGVDFGALVRGLAGAGLLELGECTLGAADA